VFETADHRGARTRPTLATEQRVVATTKPGREGAPTAATGGGGSSSDDDARDCGVVAGALGVCGIVAVGDGVESAPAGSGEDLTTRQAVQGFYQRLQRCLFDAMPAAVWCPAVQCASQTGIPLLAKGLAQRRRHDCGLQPMRHPPR